MGLARYRAADLPWDTGRPSAELQRRLKAFPVKPCRAIEFGCGTGSNAVWLAQQGFDVTAVDISPARLSRRPPARNRPAYKCASSADATALPDLGPPFEFLFDRGCYHAIRRTNAEGIIQTFEKVTAPGAIGIVLTGNSKEERKPGPPTVSEQTLRTELGRGFEILSLDEFRFDQDETAGVPPLGWSVQMRRK